MKLFYAVLSLDTQTLLNHFLITPEVLVLRKWQIRTCHFTGLILPVWKYKKKKKELKNEINVNLFLWRLTYLCIRHICYILTFLISISCRSSVKAILLLNSISIPLLRILPNFNHLLSMVHYNFNQMFVWKLCDTSKELKLCTFWWKSLHISVRVNIYTSFKAYTVYLQIFMITMVTVWIS